MSTPQAKPTPETEIEVYAQSTPNPQAFKFLTNRTIKTSGKATYDSPHQASGNELALALFFEVPGVEQLHFYDNVVTITLSPSTALVEAKNAAIQAIKNSLPRHNPDFQTSAEKSDETRKDLPEDIRRIEEILDRTIRPGLRGDGGDIEVLSYVDGQLSVRYQGACGSCPSSTMGTLQAITGILRDEFDPDIEIIPV